MIKQLIYFGWALLHLCSTAYAFQPSDHIHQLVRSFSNKLQLTQVNEAKLPAPYHYLLTQPLMTKGMETYYQRRPLIRTLYTRQNNHSHTYSRMIAMLVDKDKRKNNPELAQKRKEITIVELAYITINFDALPKKMIKEILNENVPFGQLLTENHIKTGTKDRAYFLTKCTEIIKLFLRCEINTPLYGRKNTIYRSDDKRWIAKVVEILPTMKKR